MIKGMLYRWTCTAAGVTDASIGQVVGASLLALKISCQYGGVWRYWYIYSAVHRCYCWRFIGLFHSLKLVIDALSSGQAMT